ncbi:MAG TPA: autotransporter-associated beta strand repeat-containing protein [Methylomirabilota bacterium]|nr:autotransporter-associated beta strand repeat-containing protein [Methylomirabilota bacterium]
MRSVFKSAFGRRVLAVAILGLSVLGLRAATYTWDGSANDWNSAHWMPGSTGFPGAGHVMVVNGGTVTVTDGSSAYHPASVTLNGGTLRVTSTGRLFSGADANTQVITVNTGAVLELDTWFKADSQSLGRLNQSAGRLVVNGGTIRVMGVTGYGRGVTVNAGGATLETGPDADWLLNQLTDDVAWTYQGNPTLIFAGSGIGRFEKAINSGTGGVIKRGPGKWTLARTSSYSGDTIVEEGILVLRRGSLNDTSTVSIAQGAILSLRHYEGDVIGRLILGGVTMPNGTYNRSTHPQFISGSGSLIVGGTNTSSRPSLTWFYGSGGDSAIRQELTNSMNFCVDTYNNYAYLHGNIRADYNPGVPTAQAGFGGPITFGGSRNGRVAMHEMGHVFGVGTRGEWGANLSGGIWRGPNGSRLIQQIDGPGAVIHSDGTHFWPYGLNYDSEGGARNEICHVRLVEAFMQDMGLYQGISTISSLGDRSLPTNSSTGPISVTIGDPGVAAGALVLHVKSSNPALLPASSIAVGGSGANRTVTLTPVPHMAGAALITLTVSGGRDAAIETFVLTVGGFSWVGGSGSWDMTSANWNDGTTTWPAIGGNNDALFGGTPGIVSVQGTVRADDLTFASSGYVITNGTLRFDVTPVLTVGQGATATVASVLEGAPPMTKEGPGTLILSGDNPYTGSILVNGGELFIHGSLTDAATIEVRSGAVLGGSGAFAPVTVRSGAELSPGPQPNATIVTRGLTLDNGASLTVDLDVVGDRLVVNGDAVLNGTLNVRASGPIPNGVYPILRHTGARSGAGLNLGTTPPGYSITLDQSVPGEVRLRVSGGLDPVPVVAAGRVWKFHAGGVNLGTAWRQPAYNDSAWNSGPAMLGFGDANGLAPATLVASNGQWTTYFRHRFHVPNVSQVRTLAGRILRDDAAVVYLNGLEVWRDPNLPSSGPINYNTPALAALGGADESVWINFPISPAALRDGTNVLAIEVHQNAATSSDLALNFELAATLVLPSDVHIFFSGDTLSWPAEAGWFSLYAATNLTPPVVWTRVPGVPVQSNGAWYFSLPVTTNAQTFYRLRGP